MDFQPFNLGNALSQAENIKGARQRNSLLAEQSAPNSVYRQSQQAQLVGQQQSNQQGVNQQKQFDDNQQQSNTDLIYRASEAIAKTPQLAQQIHQGLIKRGIIEKDHSIDYSNVNCYF